MTMRRAGRVYGFLAGLCVFLGPARAASAQPAPLTLVQPEVQNTSPTFRYGGPVELQISGTLPASFLHDVRAYALWAPRGEPQPQRETHDCVVYDAVRLPTEQCVSGLCLGWVDERWLSLTRGGEPQDEEPFLLVFEIGTVQVSSRTSGLDVVSIRKGDETKFFSHAVQIKVEVPGRASAGRGNLLYRISSWFSSPDATESPQSVAGPVNVDLTKVTCFEFQVAEDGERVAYLQPCNRSVS